MAWVGPSKQRFDNTKFKLTYQIFSGDIQQDEKCFVYLYNEILFRIMIYLRHTDIVRLLLVSKRLNEIVYGNKRFRKYWELSNTIINKSELYECFMKRFSELIERLDFNFNFINMLYRLQSLKN